MGSGLGFGSIPSAWRSHMAGLALAALGLCGAALPAHAAAPKAAAPAGITGVWMVEQPYQLGAALSPKPQLTPYAEGLRQRRAAAREKGYVRGFDNVLCQGGGGPYLATRRSPFDVMSGFGRIVFIFETESFNQPRTVYLNEKTHPTDIFPSWNGHSIGHWEGKTLVVDTVGFNGRGRNIGDLPQSTQQHVIERFSVSKDGKVLTDEITIEDPQILAKPWSGVMKFDRMADSEERYEVSCDVDLDYLKTMDLDALKDADTEVARFLTHPDADPALAFAVKPGQ